MTPERRPKRGRSATHAFSQGSGAQGYCVCGRNRGSPTHAPRMGEPRPSKKRLAAIWCPECGPGGAIDEDGCCTACGATATGEGADAAVTLQAALAVALEVLKRLEWSGGATRMRCPYEPCGNYRPIHAPGCALDAALKGKR